MTLLVQVLLETLYMDFLISDTFLPWKVTRSLTSESDHQVWSTKPTLTPVEDGALMWHLAMVLQCRAVPALVFELMLAFMNGHLYAL